jgi:hypothetical protein
MTWETSRITHRVRTKQQPQYQTSKTCLPTADGLPRIHLGGSDSLNLIYCIRYLNEHRRWLWLTIFSRILHSGIHCEISEINNNWAVISETDQNNDMTGLIYHIVLGWLQDVCIQRLFVDSTLCAVFDIGREFHKLNY